MSGPWPPVGSDTYDATDGMLAFLERPDAAVAAPAPEVEVRCIWCAVPVIAESAERAHLLMEEHYADTHGRRLR